jgi:hypothetical protein
MEREKKKEKKALLVRLLENHGSVFIWDVSLLRDLTMCSGHLNQRLLARISRGSQTVIPFDLNVSYKHTLEQAQANTRHNVFLSCAQYKLRRAIQTLPTGLPVAESCASGASCVFLGARRSQRLPTTPNVLTHCEKYPYCILLSCQQRR